MILFSLSQHAAWVLAACCFKFEPKSQPKG
jgi:hypothetical protein